MAMETLAARPQSSADASARQRSAGYHRLATMTLGLAGAGVVAYGVTLPWLSTFDGLLSQSGLGTRNGTILLVAAAVVAVLAVGQALTATVPLRWALGLAGFGLTAFAGHLLVQLYAVSGQLDGMSLPAKGPGLFVATGGGLLALFTLLLPMPPSTSTASASGRLGSASLRYPAAAAALAAGLAHVPVTPEHLAEAPYIGVLFILLTVTCVLGTVALLVSDSVFVWLSLGGAAALAVIAYVVSRTLGLPMMADDIGNWLEPLGVLSIATESVVVVLAATRLWLIRSRTAG